MKRLLRDLVPPVLWRLLAGQAPLKAGSKWTYGVEQPAEFYDETFESAEHWKQHYTSSRYYPLWTVIADRIQRQGTEKIVDLGCGPGQVACLMRDIQIDGYLGLDFSSARIAYAKQVCPEFTFVEADIFQSDVLQTAQYDTALIMEFLEHVEEDLSVLQRLRPRTYVLATVPNFPAAGHVRHFQSVDDVVKRYGNTIDKIRVDAVLENQKGKTYFLIEGQATGEKFSG